MLNAFQTHAPNKMYFCLGWLVIQAFILYFFYVLENLRYDENTSKYVLIDLPATKIFMKAQFYFFPTGVLKYCWMYRR